MKPMQLCRLLFYMQEAAMKYKQTNKQSKKQQQQQQKKEGRGRGIWIQLI